MSGLADFKKELEPVERAVLTEWAKAAQRTNLASLRAARGPGGASLAPNKPYTAKRKGHDRVGEDSGQMLAGLLAGDGIDVDTSGRSGKAKVYGGPGSTDLKLNIFVKGQRDGSGQMIWVSELTQSGKLKKYQVPKRRVEGRDFFGVDQRDVDAAAEDALTSVLSAWGFK